MMPGNASRRRGIRRSNSRFSSVQRIAAGGTTSSLLKTAALRIESTRASRTVGFVMRHFGLAVSLRVRLDPMDANALLVHDPEPPGDRLGIQMGQDLSEYETHGGATLRPQ